MKKKIPDLGMFLRPRYKIGGANRYEIRSAIVELVTLILRDPLDRDCGLCMHINNAYEYLSVRSQTTLSVNDLDAFGLGGYIQDVMQTWPSYSGSSLYPVPMSYTNTNRVDAIRSYDYERDKWDQTIPYGRLRVDLQHYVAQALLDQVKDG